MRRLVKAAAIAAIVLLTGCATQQPTPAAATCPNANHPKACCQKASDQMTDHKGCKKHCMKSCTKKHTHNTHVAKKKATNNPTGTTQTQGTTSQNTTTDDNEIGS